MAILPVLKDWVIALRALVAMISMRAEVKLKDASRAGQAILLRKPIKQCARSVQEGTT